MLTLLSPAKKLANVNTLCYHTTIPRFLDKTHQLISTLKEKSTEDLMTLMHISHDLAALNHKRYQDFSISNSTSGCAAIDMFQGDVYQTLKANTFDTDTRAYCQTHLGILSGLYGLLRPLDAIQPYRLEMGTRLKNAMGKDLYQCWRETVTKQLNQDAHSFILNLASLEYSSVIDEKLLSVPLINVHFKEQKQQKLVIVGINAKKARGAMAREIMINRIETIERLKQVCVLHYQYDESASTESELIFIKT